MKKILLFLLIVLPLSEIFAQADQKAAKPNIVFILSDDHSAPFVGSYGYPSINTPNLDLLAREGIQFNRAYTTSPQCVLSRASIMTGRSVVDIRMTRFSAPLPAAIPTYPELLREAGYYTGICGRTFHLDGAANNPEAKQVYETNHLKTFKNRVDFLKTGVNEDALPQFLQFLNEVPKGKPFFIQVGYNDPHRTFDATAFEPDPNKIEVPRGMPDTKALRKDLASYLGEIQRLDHNVGELLKELEKRGLTKNTLVVFMGDNGGALLRGKGTLYDLGLHVPLIARWPNKIKANQKTDVLISGEDIAPTFLAIANARIPKEVTGKSFVATFSNPSYSPRDLVFAVRGAHASALPNGTASFDLGRAVFDKRYKLVYNALWQLPYQPVDFGNQPFWIELKKQHQEGTLAPEYAALFFAAQRPMFEVFDLQEDPYELKNLAGEANISQVERKLKADLQGWMILNQDYLPLPLRQGNK